MLLVDKNSASSLVQSIYLWQSFDTMKISPNFCPDKNFLFSMLILTFLLFHWLQGILNNGVKVAIKKLIQISNSGKEKFLSEVKLMRRLQHRNLVRLIGCSIGEEDDSRFLVYEYVTNQSLDRHMFGNACLSVYYSYIM